MSEIGAGRVRRLPSGPHGLSPELVARNQRERLIAAMAEVCMEKGYGAASVAEVVGRAGVSTASFYRQFKDKRSCMLASFEELFGRLLEAVERGCAGEAEPAVRVQVGIGTAVDLLSADPPTARLLTVEIAAVGVEGVRLQHEAIERVAARLRVAREADVTAPASTSEWAVIAAMVALVARRSVEGEALDPAELEAVCG